MFNNAKSFDQDIGDWEVVGVSDMSRMFTGAEAFRNGLFVAGIERWDLSTVSQAVEVCPCKKIQKKRLTIAHWNITAKQKACHQVQKRTLSCDLFARSFMAAFAASCVLLGAPRSASRRDCKMSLHSSRLHV